MTRPARGRIASATIALVAVAATASAHGVAARHLGGAATLEVTVNQLPMLLFAIVGALLVLRRPEQAIGWLLALCGVSLLLTPAVTAYVDATLLPSGGAALPTDPRLALVGNPVSVVGLAAGLVLLPLLYPTGRPVSPRWRVVVRIATVALVVVVVSAPFAEDRLRVGPESARVDLGPNPFLAWPGAQAAQVLGLGAFLVLVGFVPLAAASLLQRVRRARGVEREQLRWLGAGLAAVVAVFVALLIGELLLGIVLPPLAWDAAHGAAIAVVPLSIAAAVTRHGLYEIDRILSRTVTYLAVTVVLAGTYAAAVLGLGAVLGPSSDLAVAASTLLIAALFLPLRRRVQSGVDRRFNRARYDAQRTVEGFRDQLRAEVDLDEVADHLLDAVGRTVQPTGASLWLRGGAR